MSRITYGTALWLTLHDVDMGRSEFSVFVSWRCWGQLEREKHLWHPSELLPWLCVWVWFNHCNPPPPPPPSPPPHPWWLILFDWDLHSTQIIAPHQHVIPSWKRRINMFSAVRYFYPPTSPSVNYSKYSYIKIKPCLNRQSAAGCAHCHNGNSLMLPPRVYVCVFVIPTSPQKL